METITTQEFLNHKNLALIRLSRITPVVGIKIDDELAKKGYDISVVYLEASNSEPTIADVKDQVEGAIIAVPKKNCADAVFVAALAEIPRLWIQNGCASKEAIALCEEECIPVVANACVLMYAEPVKSIHAFHRRLWKLFGKLIS